MASRPATRLLASSTILPPKPPPVVAWITRMLDTGTLQRRRQAQRAPGMTDWVEVQTTQPTVRVDRGHAWPWAPGSRGTARAWCKWPRGPGAPRRSPRRRRRARNWISWRHVVAARVDAAVPLRPAPRSGVRIAGSSSYSTRIRSSASRAISSVQPPRPRLPRRRNAPCPRPGCGAPCDAHPRERAARPRRSAPP